MTDAVTDTLTEAEQASAGESHGPARPTTVTAPRLGSLPTRAQQAAAAKDKTLTSPAAVSLCHDALAEITDPLSIGAHVGSRCESERVVAHLFDCNLTGYRGWRWSVTLTRPPRGRTATICEMELLPGEEALLAPAWVPWAERLQPGDVSRSDRLPRKETDERLEPGWEATGEDEGDVVGTDALDFGRARVLSPAGIQQAAQRWYEGEHGPQAEGVSAAQAMCSACGFFMPVSGALRNVFGICANEWAPDDGSVVSLDHGCGAHSETDLADQGPEWPVTPARLDEDAVEVVVIEGAGADGQDPASEPGEPAVSRGGRSRGRERTCESARSETTEPGTSKVEDGPDEAPALEGSQPEVSEEPTEVPAQDEVEAPASRRARKPEAAPAARSRKAASSRQGRKSDEGKQEKAPAAPSRRRRKAVQEPVSKVVDAESRPVAEPVAEDRHGSALAAVAQLAAEHAHPEEVEARPSTATLEELEAHLPSRG